MPTYIMYRHINTYGQLSSPLTRFLNLFDCQLAAHCRLIEVEVEDWGTYGVHMSKHELPYEGFNNHWYGHLLEKWNVTTTWRCVHVFHLPTKRYIKSSICNLDAILFMQVFRAVGETLPRNRRSKLKLTTYFGIFRQVILLPLFFGII